MSSSSSASPPSLREPPASPTRFPVVHRRFRRALSFARPLGSPIRLASPPLTPAEHTLSDPFDEMEDSTPALLGVLASPIKLTSEISTTEWSTVQQRLRLPVPRSRNHHCSRPDCPISLSELPPSPNATGPDTRDTPTTPCKHPQHRPIALLSSPFELGSVFAAQQQAVVPPRYSHRRRINANSWRTCSAQKRKATSPLPARTLPFRSGLAPPAPTRGDGPTTPSPPQTPTRVRHQQQRPLPLSSPFAVPPCTPRRTAPLSVPGAPRARAVPLRSLDSDESDCECDACGGVAGDDDDLPAFPIKRRLLERLPSPPKTP